MSFFYCVLRGYVSFYKGYVSGGSILISSNFSGFSEFSPTVLGGYFCMLNIGVVGSQWKGF